MWKVSERLLEGSGRAEQPDGNLRLFHFAGERGGSGQRFRQSLGVLDFHPRAKTPGVVIRRPLIIAATGLGAAECQESPRRAIVEAHTAVKGQGIRKQRVGAIEVPLLVTGEAQLYRGGRQSAGLTQARE